MTIILGTICHNDDDHHSADCRRVELWLDDDGRIWADRDNPHTPDVPIARDADHARDIVRSAWSGDVWDLQLS